MTDVFDSPATSAIYGQQFTREGRQAPMSDDLEEYLAAHESHGRLVREIAKVDDLIAQAQRRRDVLVTKLVEVDQVMREKDPHANRPRRADRIAEEEQQVLAALPGRINEIALRSGLGKERVQQLMTRLRQAGRVERRNGYQWFAAGEENA